MSPTSYLAAPPRVEGPQVYSRPPERSTPCDDASFREFGDAGVLLRKGDSFQDLLRRTSKKPLPKGSSGTPSPHNQIDQPIGNEDLLADGFPFHETLHVVLG